MKPIEFNEKNCVYAEHQDEYLNLPAQKTEDGRIISCWKLTWKERIKALFNGKLWISQMTFHTPLQPILPSVDKLSE